MATPNQRALSIVEALINSASTASQRDRISAAFGEGLPAGSTSTVISQKFISVLRGYVFQRVIDFEAGAGVETAKAAAATNVTASFPEAP